MPEEDSSLPPPQNDWEHDLGDVDLPRKNELSIGVVLDYMEQFRRGYQTRGTTWERTEVRERIKQDIGFEEPVLRGGVEIGKGEKLLLVVNYNQNDALDVVYGINLVVLLAKDRTFYALVETTGKDPKRMEVEIKYASGLKSRDINHFMISQALADQLGMDERREVRLLEVYQKIEDVDFDKI